MAFPLIRADKKSKTEIPPGFGACVEPVVFVEDKANPVSAIAPILVEVQLPSS